MFKVNNKDTRIRKVNDKVRNKDTVDVVQASLLLTLIMPICKNLCFTEFSTKIHWNTKLAASDGHMFTRSIKVF